MYSHSGQLVYPGGYGPLPVKKPRDDELQAGPPGRCNTMRGPSGLEGPAQRPYGAHPEAPNFSGLAVARAAAKSDNHRERSRHPPWPEHSSRYSQLAAPAEPSEKPDWGHQLLDRPSTSHKKDERAGFKEPSMVGSSSSGSEEFFCSGLLLDLIGERIQGYGGRKSRIHYSGPLMPPGGNIEEMLKEHERQIQHAVRKARLDKAKTRKVFGEKGQFEALLHGRADGSDA